MVAAALAVSGAALADWPSAQRDPAQRIESATAARRVELLQEWATRNPSAVEPLVLRALEDPDERVRVTAAELAGRLRIRPARAIVERWIDEPQSTLRAAAARALATLADGAAIPMLTRLFNDRDAEVKLAAVQAIGAIGGGAAVVPLLDRLSDDDSDVRIAAARALGELGDRRAVLSLLGILQDPTPEVREAACNALGRLQDERASRAIVALLRDPTPEVRLAAARAIGALGSAATVVDLAPVALGAEFISDLSQRVELARAAVNSIGRIGGTEAMTLLVRVFRTSASQDIARAAADALRAMGDRAREAIPTLAAEPVPPSAREPLVILLGELGGDVAADALLGLSEASRPPSAEVYWRALGRTGSARALYALLRAATERETSSTRQTSFGSIASVSPARRSAALRAVEAWVSRRGELEPSALDPLLVILREVQSSSSPIVARASVAAGPSPDLLLVIKLIGETRNPRAPAALAPLLSSADRALRVAVAQALTRVGVAGIERQVVALLADSTPAVRSSAADALARFGARAALDALGSAWSGERPIDRASAAVAIGRISARLRDISRAATLARALGDARPALACALVDALGSFASVGSVDARVALEGLVDGRGPLSNAAIEALSNAAHSATDEARPALLASLRARASESHSEAVRATAVWGLGADRSSGSWATLLSAAREPSNALAANALGALARTLSAGVTSTDDLRAAACDALERRANPMVKANALALLAAARQRCEQDPARRLLFAARSPWVRLAAARALGSAAVDEAQRRTASELLLRCATTDRAALVAQQCRTMIGPRTSPATRRPDEPIDALVLGEDEDAPATNTAYVLVRPDGLARFGVTGWTGWIRERPSPPGEFTLIEPTQLANEP